MNRATNLHQILHLAWTFLHGNYSDDSEGFQGWYNEFNAIKLWHKYFKDGWESVESETNSGRPAISRTPESVECVQAAINNDWRLTVRELEADLGIPKTVSENLMQDLGMKCVAAKFILRLLLPEQKAHWAAVVNDLIQTSTNEPNNDLSEKEVK